ncbi:MAG: hypothetical protein M1839_005891, partial [Geoglossum umbratile]
MTRTNAVFDRISADSEERCSSPNTESTTDGVINSMLEGSADGGEAQLWDMPPGTNGNHSEERRPVSASDTQEPTIQNSAQPPKELPGLEAVPLPEAGGQEQLAEESTTPQGIAEEEEQ